MINYIDNAINVLKHQLDKNIFVIFIDKDGTLTNADLLFRKNKNDKTLGDMSAHEKFEGKPLLEAALYFSLKGYNNIIPYRSGADSVTNSWKDIYEVIIATKSPGSNFDSYFGELIRSDLRKTLDKNNIYYDDVVFAEGFKRNVALNYLPIVIIEDNPNTIIKLRKAGFNVIRIETPYNKFMRQSEINDGLTYVAENWNHVGDIVNDIYNKTDWKQNVKTEILLLEKYKEILINTKEDKDTKIYMRKKEIEYLRRHSHQIKMAEDSKIFIPSTEAKVLKEHKILLTQNDPTKIYIPENDNGFTKTLIK